MVAGIAASVAALFLPGRLVVVPLIAGLALLAGHLGLKQADFAVPWTRGAVAEEEVGALLESLRADGFEVIHDLEQRYEGNVDHLVCGPTGVFMVETKFKSYRDEAIPKAKRQAKRLHADLGVWVTPVICVAMRERAPFQHRGVWVMDSRHLLDWVRGQRNRPAEDRRVQRLVDRA